MVTNIDTNDNEPVINDLTPVETTDETTTPDVPVETNNENTEIVADALATAPEPVPEPTEPVAEAPAPVQAPPPMSQQQIEELKQYREAHQERDWRDKVGRQARAYEQQLNNQGYLPEQAREQARRFIQGQQQQREAETKASSLVEFVEGRQAAAMHYLKENGLVTQQMLDDLMALQRANTPDEMQREANRMKRERALIAENARLKQGLVQPQSFDNSQGAAEAQPNDARLLDAYINGDRSEAAIRAVERSMNGG